MDNPTPRFTGIFIPTEVLQLENLSLFEMLLLSWIDALFCSHHGGCYASNEYLATRLKHAKVNTVVKALVKLRKLGLVVDVSFNGRKRVIRACIGKVIEKAQSKPPTSEGQSHADCDLNHMQGVTKITPWVGQKSHPGTPSPYIESKEENKDKNIAQTTPSLRQKTSEIFFSFEQKKFLGIEDADLKKWNEVYPGINVPRELLLMTEWCLSNPSKAKNKKKWRKFITTWLQSHYERVTNRDAYRNFNTKQAPSRHRGFQRDTSPINPDRVLDFSKDIELSEAQKDFLHSKTEGG
jgi:hypothetical protein